jgi:hypothetical protein
MKSDKNLSRFLPRLRVAATAEQGTGERLCMWLGLLKKYFVNLSANLGVPLWLNLTHLTTKDHEERHKVTQRVKTK